MKTVIVNGRIITDSGIFTDAGLCLENGRITGFTTQTDGFDKILDAQGLYVSPGFIDLHTHGGAGCDFMDGTTHAVETACNFHMRHGTTTLFPTTCTQSFESTKAALSAIRQAKALNNIAGAHMESFFFSQAKAGAQNPQYVCAPTGDIYKPFIEEFGDIIRRWSYAPERAGANEFEKYCSEHGVLLSAGHTDSEYEDMVRAHENGCRLITHMYCCTSTIVKHAGFRSIGVIETAYLYDDIYIELITDGCHIPPELLQLAYKLKTDDRICLVTDSNACTGTDAKTGTISGLPCIIEDGVAKKPDRSGFAGSVATADRLVRECLKAGIPLQSAVKMITRTPASVMKLQNKGRLEVGADADIILFDDDIDVKTVIIGGKVV